MSAAGGEFDRRATAGSLQPVVVVGEALIDLLPRPHAVDASGRPAVILEAVPGGSPANVAVGLTRQGVPTRFVGRFANHGLGPWRKGFLRQEGVDLSLSVDVVDPATLALVTFDEQRGATYDFYGRDSADWQWRRHELPDPERLEAAAVHTGSLATVISPGAERLGHWLSAVRSRNDVVVSYDPNVRLGVVGDRDGYRRLLARVLAESHLVKASEEDLALLWPDRSIVEIGSQWLDTTPGLTLVVITRGSRGCLALHRDGRRLEKAAPAAEVVDTVGAGDAFTAGFLSRLWSTGRLNPDALAGIGDAALLDALDHANQVAAMTCGRPGADPPYASDLIDAPAAPIAGDAPTGPGA